MPKQIFCAACQLDTPHTADLSGPELVVTCSVCGQFNKFPATKDARVYTDLFARHKAANLGQIAAVEYIPDPDVLSAFDNA